MTSVIWVRNARRLGATMGAFFLASWMGIASAQPGSLDTSYGSGGSYISGVALGDSVRALALQSDNKAILAGNCNSVSPATSFCVTRVAPNCSFRRGSPCCRFAAQAPAPNLPAPPPKRTSRRCHNWCRPSPAARRPFPPTQTSKTRLPSRKSGAHCPPK